MPPIWRHHYQYWTAADLLISNLLRAEPLGYEVLTQYGDHSLNSIRTTMNLLRRQGRVSRHGEVIPEHPKNIRMTTGVPFGPLPDPGSLPTLPTFVEGRLTATTHALSALAEPEPDGLTIAKGAKILEKWITEGSAGKDTPRFMQVWREMVGSGHGSGPPPPTTPLQYSDRLFLLLSSSPESACRTAIARWEASLAKRPNRSPQAVPGHPDLVDHHPALGAGDPHPPGPHPPPPGPGLPLENPLC